jgi:hypothetical protein
MAFEQIHAMVRLGFLSVRCRKPEMGFLATTACPELSQATLPHLSIADVQMYLDTLSAGRCRLAPF